MRTLLAITAALLMSTGVAFADPNGGVDDKNPAESRNPNDDRSGPGASGPGGGASNNLFQAPTFSPADAYVVMSAGTPNDNPGTDDNNGTGNDPQGNPGQKGQPGKEGSTGP